MRPRPFSLHSLSQKAFHLLPWLVFVGLLFYNLAFLFNSPSILNSLSLGDFGSFVASGLAVKDGENPYGIYPLTSKARYQGIVEYFPNMNPPVSILIFDLLAVFEPAVALRIWTVLSFLFYLGGLILLYRNYHPDSIWFGWALVLAGFWDTLALGQIYTLLFAILVVAWMCLRSHHETAAGILIGILVAIKPNLLLWPVLLFLAGYRRPAIWGFATTLALSILPIFRYGTQVYLQWFEVVSQASWISMPHYLSLFGVAARFDIPWLGPVLALVLLIFVTWWAWKYRPDTLATSEIALIASILASPLATPRFTLFLVPFFFMEYQDARRKLPAALFLFPTSLIIWLGFQSQPLRLFVGLIYPFALSLLLLRTMGKLINQRRLTIKRTV